MQTAVHTSRLFVFVPLLFICKVKEYSSATLRFLNFFCDHCLTVVSIASLRDVSVLGTAKSLILQVLLIVRINFPGSGQEKNYFVSLFMKRCVHC